MRWTILVLLSMWSACAIAQSQQRVSRAVELEHDLTTYSLTQAQLEAFSKRGEQKLRDFFGLLGYQANQQYATMNTVSATERRSISLFRDTAVTLDPLFDVGEPLPIADYLNEVENAYESVAIHLDSLVWITPFAAAMDGIHQGYVQYQLRAHGFQDGKLVATRTGQQTAVLWLRQVSKDFGRRGSDLVWEVSLGDIRWVEEE